MSVQAVVTLDRSDLANLTTNLGGISVGRQLLMGADLAAAFDTASLNGSAVRMAFEGLATQALIQALANQHWTPGRAAVYLQQLPRAVLPQDAAALPDLSTAA